MKVSVAIPCYNGMEYVGQTIESVLAQSRPADEVLVIDDGSNDQSAEIAGRYPVNLIRHGHNRGLSAARNTAIAAASGDILAFIDVDAQADEAWLASLLAGYDCDDVVGVGGRGIEANIQSEVDLWRKLHASQGHGAHTQNEVDFLFGLCMSFRRAALLRVAGFDTRLRTNAEDMDIGFRLNDSGGCLHYTPNALVYHQRSDDYTSLERTMYNWYYWAFVVKQKNGRNPWTLAAGVVRRLIWSDTPPDLFVRRDLTLATLDIRMAFAKARAVIDAARAVY